MEGRKYVYSSREEKEIYLISANGHLYMVEINVDRYYHRTHYNLMEVSLGTTFNAGGEPLEEKHMCHDIKYMIEDGDNPDDSLYFPDIVEPGEWPPSNDQRREMDRIINDLRSLL